MEFTFLPATTNYFLDAFMDLLPCSRNSILEPWYSSKIGHPLWYFKLPSNHDEWLEGFVYACVQQPCMSDQKFVNKHLDWFVVYCSDIVSVDLEKEKEDIRIYKNHFLQSRFLCKIFINITLHYVNFRHKGPKKPLLTCTKFSQDKIFFESCWLFLPSCCSCNILNDVGVSS